MALKSPGRMLAYNLRCLQGISHGVERASSDLSCCVLGCCWLLRAWLLRTTLLFGIFLAYDDFSEIYENNLLRVLVLCLSCSRHGSPASGTFTCRPAPHKTQECNGLRDNMGLPDIALLNSSNPWATTTEDLQRLFDKQISKLLKLIDTQLQSLLQKQPQARVSHLVLSGGLGNSAYVQSALRRHYAGTMIPNAQSISVRIAPDPQLV